MLRALGHDLRDALRLGDWGALLAAYEQLWLCHLGLDVRADRARLGRAFSTLSAGLTTGRARLTEAPSGRWGGPDMVAAQALTHGARSFLIVARWLRARRLPGPRGVLDLGCGAGTAALGAWAMGVEQFVLEDLALESATTGARLLRELGAQVEVCQRDVGLAAGATAPGWLAVAAFVGNERHDGDPEAMAALWARWLHRAEEVLILEPGTKGVAQTVAGARDHMTEQVSGPCTHHLSCPRGPGTRDWCHFSLPFPVGPVGRGLFEDGGVDCGVLHFSSVSLARCAVPRPGHGRVLERWGDPRRKELVSVCESDGQIRRYAILGRHRSAVEDLWPGALVGLPEPRPEPRGDGVRW